MRLGIKTLFVGLVALACVGCVDTPRWTAQDSENYHKKMDSLDAQIVAGGAAVSIGRKIEAISGQTVSSIPGFQPEMVKNFGDHQWIVKSWLFVGDKKISYVANVFYAGGGGDTVVTSYQFLKD